MRILLACCALALLGCQAARLPAIADTHPANPSAHQAPVPAQSDLLRVEAEKQEGTRAQFEALTAPISHPHSHMGDGSMNAAPKAPEDLYTCPMHPEVVSKQPGECPKCGMALVRKEPAKEAE